MTEKKTYCCEHCLKEFLQKNDYLRHINKKYPCVTKDQLKELKDNELIELKEKMTELDALKFLESFFNKIKDLLRDQESITSDRALDVITDFLFLRLLNYEMETNPDMNFITKKYNQKVKINNYDFDLDEYKKYFKWENLMNLVESIDKDSSNQENKQLLVDVISHVIFGGIFKFNDNTKEIYKNRRFFVKKLTTIQRLLKEFNKIDFTKYNVDIKGKAYEMTLQKESVTNSSFGQFFTPTWIDKYMVSNIKININKDGSYTKILDPACGTAGILCEYVAEVKRRSEKEKIKLDKNVSNYIYGCEIVDDTLKLAHMNMLLKSGSYNNNLKNIDFLEVECLDYVDEKLDANIIMNPPFALTKKYHLYDDDISKKIFYGETKSGTMLFLMAGLNSIKEGNQLIMVSPNGKEIFSKNKEFVNIRKKTMEQANIFKIAILPDKSFNPYTSVQTLILMMEKGKKTDKIEFVKLEKEKDDTLKEIKLCSVKFKELEKKNYSWNYKEYFTEKTIEYNNIDYKKIEEICDVYSAGKRNSSEGKTEGKFPLFYCSILGNLYLDEYDFDEENIIINSTNGSGKCEIYYWNGKFSTAHNTIRFKSSNNNILTKYIFYYFKNNKNLLEEKFMGMNQKKITIDDLKIISIPIPPLPVQNLIVKELDSYYKIKESIQNTLEELEVQKKGKFELLLDLCKNKKETKLGEIVSFKSGKFNSGDKKSEGKYKFFTSDAIQPSGYYDEYCFEGDKYIILIKDGGSGSGIYGEHIELGKVFLIEKEKTCATSHQLALYFDENYKNQINYVYCYLQVNKNSIMDLAHYTNGLGCISMEKLKNFSLQIPSLEDQEKIIKSMEYFDELKKMYQTHITNTELQIKERFEYHLNKCKKFAETVLESKEESNSESEKEEEKHKVVKKSSKTNKIDTCNESEEEKITKKSSKIKKTNKIESNDKLDKEKITKKSSKKSSKKVISTDDELSDLEKELENITKTNTNKIKVKEDKKEKKNKSTSLFIK
jgi:type I restriction-modification system DNA methylase subunit